MGRGIRPFKGVGRGVGRGRRQRASQGPEPLRRMIEELPPELARLTLTHSSWSEHRADSYGRLAFLGDSVLGLTVAEHLFHRFGRSDIGHLTKVHGQAVSGRACAEVAVELGVPARLREVAPGNIDGGIGVDALLASERALASICEAVIGACYLHHGFEPTKEATLAAFSQQIELAAGTLLDFKSALQELVARSGSKVRYEVVGETGPPHDRRFEVRATIDGKAVGTGGGRSKKTAEQAAASEALQQLRG